ncbi:helix-turn-helix domain-containing protein [Enterococcus avium]|uniref:helix-turn-helix domain-containing protein n=1 Tax=Enterococcus avium TaxID=33945 RepID=UPI0037A6E748
MNPYEKIKELTKERGISVRELEKRLGFSNGYFSKWKNVSPNSDGLQKVANYFDVSVDYLLDRTDNSSPIAKPEEGFLRLNMTDLTPEEREEVEKDIDDIYQLALQKIKKRREMINRD